MPVKLKQLHYAQAPQPFFTALIAFRHQTAHLRALCEYYNNIISEPFPSCTLVHTLCDQITASQKQYTATKEHLALVSDEVCYYEDPSQTTWVTRPARRRYEYEAAQEKPVERPKDTEEQIVKELSETNSPEPNLRYSSDEDSNSNSDNDSTTSTNTTIVTPPSSPPSPTPSPCRKHVHFGPVPTPRRRAVERISTKEEVEAEFQAANAVPIKTWDQSENSRKRKRGGQESDQVEVSRKRLKRLKRLHLWTWPDAYFEDV